MTSISLGKSLIRLFFLFQMITLTVADLRVSYNIDTARGCEMLTGSHQQAARMQRIRAAI